MKGFELKNLRNEKGWTQEQLAEMLSVSKRTVINWEQSEDIAESKVKLLHSLFDYDVTNSEINVIENEDALTDRELKEIAYVVVDNFDDFKKVKIFNNLIKIELTRILMDIRDGKYTINDYLDS